MKPFPLLLGALLALGACASTPAPPAPEPQPRAEPATAPQPPEAPAAAAEPAATPPVPVAPERWLHLHTFGDGVPGAAVDSAYALLAGRTAGREVVVAVIDGGVDITHEELDGVLWVNEDEVPGNGVEDDGNGYVDDIHGWNFIGGPSGESVDHDTYELTRLHAACLGRPAAGPLEAPGAAACAALAAAYEEERQELMGMSMQLQQISAMVDTAMAALGRALNGNVTPERVAALRPLDAQVGQARQMYLQLQGMGIDQAVIADEGEAIQSLLEYGLNLDFDPRHIVGDDYADPTERFYGNADVAGPDPGHGTAVASLIAAERDNGVGIDGVTDAVRIMAVRAVPNGDERDKDVANAIRYAVDNGAHIINMSFGKAYSPFKEVVDQAVAYAGEHGVLLVHAAGNDATDLAETPNFPNDVLPDGQAALWLEVGASAWQGPDRLAAVFTNYGGAEVDVFAPGTTLMTAVPGDEYGPSDGTSLAAPVVSGVAALLMGHFPDLGAAETRTLILETATPLPDQVVVLPGSEQDTIRFGDLSVTGGIVNAAAAVQRALERAGNR